MNPTYRKKEIEYFINSYDFSQFPWLNDMFSTKAYQEEIINDFNMLKSKLIKYWYDYPDWRFTQLLVNTRLIPNTPGMWYYTEDYELLQLQNIDLSRFLTWTSLLNKEEKLLKKPKVRFLYELDKDHIIKILETQNLSLHYSTTFKKLINEMDNRLEV